MVKMKMNVLKCINVENASKINASVASQKLQIEIFIKNEIDLFNMQIIFDLKADVKLEVQLKVQKEMKFLWIAD